MSMLPTIFSASLSDATALIYGFYPHRIQKGSRLWYEAEKQFIKDLESAKKKVLMACRTFGCVEHPSIEIDWFNATVDSLKKRGVIIVMVSEEDPPEFFKSQVDSGKISFIKSACALPFVGRLIDNKVIDICLDMCFKKDGLSPGGMYWRTERGMPDMVELIENMLFSVNPHHI